MTDETEVPAPEPEQPDDLIEPTPEPNVSAPIEAPEPTPEPTEPEAPTDTPEPNEEDTLRLKFEEAANKRQ